MDSFVCKKIREGVYCILDADEDSFYLVEGESCAAVIDTGITRDTRIMPLLKKLTDKPMVLILTHAHIDHIHHMDEFETVYLCHDELTMPEAFLHEHKAGKNLDFYSTVHMDTGTLIDLGGRVLEICKIPGHTPGSVAIYDAKVDLVFTGDAIGSGAGVWLQFPGCKPLEEYEKSLRFFFQWLVERGGAMEFWGGHSEQFRISRQIPGYNPLSMGLLADLIDLVHLVRTEELVGEVTELSPHLRMREACYAAYGRAEMLYNPDNL